MNFKQPPQIKLIKALTLALALCLCACGGSTRGTSFERTLITGNLSDEQGTLASALIEVETVAGVVSSESDQNGDYAFEVEGLQQAPTLLFSVTLDDLFASTTLEVEHPQRNLRIDLKIENGDLQAIEVDQQDSSKDLDAKQLGFENDPIVTTQEKKDKKHRPSIETGSTLSEDDDATQPLPGADLDPQDPEQPSGPYYGATGDAPDPVDSIESVTKLPPSASEDVIEVGVGQNAGQNNDRPSSNKTPTGQSSGGSDTGSGNGLFFGN